MNAFTSESGIACTARVPNACRRSWNRSHAAGAIAKHSRRGWRIDRPNPRVEIDGVSALLMALDRLENRPADVQLLDWL